MKWLTPYALISIGAILGANTRFILGSWVGSTFGARFPFGTFFINVSGSFLLGVVGSVVANRLVSHPDAVRLALGVGFLGAYTTFSTFSYENHALFDDGEWMSGIINIFISPLLGLFAVHLGMVLTRKWLT